jgi:hypothetical protein
MNNSNSLVGKIDSKKNLTYFFSKHKKINFFSKINLRITLFFLLTFITFLSCEKAIVTSEKILKKHKNKLEIWAEAFHFQKKINGLPNNSMYSYRINSIYISLLTNEFEDKSLKNFGKEYQSFDDVLRYIGISKKEFYDQIKLLKKFDLFLVKKDTTVDTIEFGVYRGFDIYAGLLYIPKTHTLSNDITFIDYHQITKFDNNWYFFWKKDI